jgi:hypothetical protein
MAIPAAKQNGETESTTRRERDCSIAYLLGASLRFSFGKSLQGKRLAVCRSDDTEEIEFLAHVIKPA